MFRSSNEHREKYDAFFWIKSKEYCQFLESSIFLDALIEREALSYSLEVRDYKVYAITKRKSQKLTVFSS